MGVPWLFVVVACAFWANAPEVEGPECRIAATPPNRWYTPVDPGSGALRVSSLDRADLFVHCVPRTEARPVSLAGRLDATKPDGDIDLGPYAYTTTADLPAAWVDFANEDRRGRRGVLRAPHADVVVTISAPRDRWPELTDDLQAMVASLRVLPGVEEVPWADEPVAEPHAQPLLEARRAVQPTTKDVRAKGTADLPADTPFAPTTYASDGHELALFRIPPPADGVPRPAVIWVQPWWEPEDRPWRRGPPARDLSALRFADAGFQVFVPTFRGALDNPGHTEWLFGEVDDLLAAIDHVKAQPGVDPERVWLVGGPTGGLAALLAAVAGAEVRGMVVLGSPVVLEGLLIDDPEVHVGSDPMQELLRSPLPWAHHIRSHVLWFQGDESRLVDGFALQRAAPDAVRAMAVPRTDVFEMVTPVMDVLVPKMRDDDPSQPMFTVSEGELLDAVLATYAAP